jgi:hypothetical protein
MTSRIILLVNLAPSLPFALWLILRHRYRAALYLVVGTVLATLLWPLPPVPTLFALTVALSLKDMPATA